MAGSPHWFFSAGESDQEWRGIRCAGSALCLMHWKCFDQADAVAYGSASEFPPNSDGSIEPPIAGDRTVGDQDDFAVGPPSQHQECGRPAPHDPPFRPSAHSGSASDSKGHGGTPGRAGTQPLAVSGGFPGFPSSTIIIYRKTWPRGSARDRGFAMVREGSAQGDRTTTLSACARTAGGVRTAQAGHRP
jgi:hypothetical protein